jgi:hypothetical protein
MAKVQMSVEQVLQLIKLGLDNGRYEAAGRLVQDLLEQIQTDPKFQLLREEASPEQPNDH